MATFLIGVYGTVYCSCIIAFDLIRGRLRGHTMLQAVIALGIYGQVIRLWVQGEHIDQQALPVAWVLLGHGLMEAGWWVYSGTLMGVVRDQKRVMRTRLGELSTLRLVVIVGAVTTISIISWFTFFREYGGMIAYMQEGMIDKRVALSSGRGYLLILIGMAPLMNYLLFAGMVYSWRKYSRLKLVTMLVLWAGHSLAIWVMAIPLGQRGGLLTPVAYWLLIYSGVRGRIRMSVLLLVGALLLVMLNVASVVRTQKSLELDSSSHVLDYIKSGWGFEMRLETLVQIMDQVPKKLEYQWGKTYVTAITQVVPRAWWPGKWSPAGVLITENITRAGDYTGFTNEQPTMWGEAYLNFSYIGLIVVPLLFGLTLGYVDYIRDTSRTYSSAILCAHWILIVVFAVNGDFVNALFVGVINSGILWAGARMCSCKRMAVAACYVMRGYSGTG